MGYVRRARSGSAPQPAPAAGSGRARRTAASSSRPAQPLPPKHPLNPYDNQPAPTTDNSSTTANRQSPTSPTTRLSPTVTQPSGHHRADQTATPDPNPHDLARSQPRLSVIAGTKGSPSAPLRSLTQPHYPTTYHPTTHSTPTKRCHQPVTARPGPQSSDPASQSTIERTPAECVRRMVVVTSRAKLCSGHYLATTCNGVPSVGDATR